MLGRVLRILRKNKDIKKAEKLLSYENTIKEKNARINDEKPMIKENNITQEGVDLIKYFEGFSSTAYEDVVGVLTIGYGTTENVKVGDVITEEEAEERLIEFLERNGKSVKKLISVEINDQQFSAIMSFVYNVGVNAFANSTMLRLLNSGNYKGAANEFDRWVHAGGVRLNGLVRRRKAEKAMFMGEDYTIHLTKGQ